MAKSKDTLSPRQRLSQRIMREKMARRRRKEALRKLQIIGGSLGAVLLVTGGFWAIKSGMVMRQWQAACDGAYGMTARAGFTLQSIYLEGRNRTPMADIEKAIGVKKGDPILRLSLDGARLRLEKLESIKLAAVERELPGTLYVRIIEREPVALWQRQGKVSLVDDNGIVMSGIEPAPYKNLPLIVGVGAPKHVAELLEILAAEPELAKRFAAAIRVGERRWNIRLASGIEIKLPENNAIAAWRQLADLQTRQQVLDRSVKVIDLRLSGRLFIKVAPQEAPRKTANAKET